MISVTRRCDATGGTSFGPMLAAEIRRRRVSHMRGFRHWRWHLDEMYVKMNGEMVYLWRAVDHEGEVLEFYVTKRRDKSAALAFMKKALKRHGKAETIVTDGLKSYPAATRDLGNEDRREMGRWLNDRAENSHLPFRRRAAGHAAIQAYEVTAEICIRYTLRFTITSTRNATSSIAKLTNFAARPPWPSGKISRHELQLILALSAPTRRQVVIRLTAP